MAAFAPVASAEESSDGYTLTLEDESPYGVGNNDQNYVIGDFTRSFVLSDAYNNVLATIPIPGTDLTVPYTLTADMWISAQLVLVGEGGYTVTIAIPCDRITKNLYRTMLQQGCCANNIIDERLELALEYLTGCAIAALSGNGPEFDTDITAAYNILTGPKF